MPAFESPSLRGRDVRHRRVTELARSRSSSSADGAAASGARGWLNWRRKRNTDAEDVVDVATADADDAEQVVASGAASAMSVKSKCIAPLMTALNATPDGSRCITAASVEPLAEMDPKERRRNGRRANPATNSPRVFGTQTAAAAVTAVLGGGVHGVEDVCHDPFDPAEAANDRFAAGWRGGTPEPPNPPNPRTSPDPPESSAPARRSSRPRLVLRSDRSERCRGREGIGGRASGCCERFIAARLCRVGETGVAPNPGAAPPGNIRPRRSTPRPQNRPRANRRNRAPVWKSPRAPRRQAFSEETAAKEEAAEEAAEAAEEAEASPEPPANSPSPEPRAFALAGTSTLGAFALAGTSTFGAFALAGTFAVVHPTVTTAFSVTSHGFFARPVPARCRLRLPPDVRERTSRRRARSRRALTVTRGSRAVAAQSRLDISPLVTQKMSRSPQTPAPRTRATDTESRPRRARVPTATSTDRTTPRW